MSISHTISNYTLLRALSGDSLHMLEPKKHVRYVETLEYLMPSASWPLFVMLHRDNTLLRVSCLSTHTE